MIAREICDRIENGRLCVVDGWEGIRSGMMHAESITLSEGSETPFSVCTC